MTLILPGMILAANRSELVKGPMLGKRRLEKLKLNSSLNDLPAISWYVLVMIKSVAFMAMVSAMNWQEKWYFGSSSFHLMSESSYLVFSKACAMVPCFPSAW